MVADSTAIPRKRFSGVVIATEIYFAGKPRRFGETIESDDYAALDHLRQSGAIADIKRIAVATSVEMAVVEAPEDTSRNYRRRGR